MFQLKTYCALNSVNLLIWMVEIGIGILTELDSNPNVGSRKDLRDSHTYIGRTDAVKDKNGKVIENYRKDGSIIYSNETSAYNRMWSQANDHYNQKKKSAVLFYPMAKFWLHPIMKILRDLFLDNYAENKTCYVAFFQRFALFLISV